MPSVTLRDQNENRTEYDVAFVPRVGERILLESSADSGTPQYYRVKDVLHRLTAEPARRVEILIEEEIAGTV
jgi:hypothetical protein